MEEPKVTCELDKHLKNIADIIKGDTDVVLEGNVNATKWLQYIALCITGEVDSDE